MASNMEVLSWPKWKSISEAGTMQLEFEYIISELIIENGAPVAEGVRVNEDFDVKMFKLDYWDESIEAKAFFFFNN